jgi:hypothetical protein
MGFLSPIFFKFFYSDFAGWFFMLFLSGTIVLLFKVELFGSFSRFALQSFMPNPGTKGFPLHTSEANWRSNRGWRVAYCLCSI